MTTFVPAFKDVRKDQRYQVDIKVPNSAGRLDAPAAGLITGVKLRLSATQFGAALDATLNDLPATEAPGLAGRFFVDVDTAPHVQFVLPLGAGASYFAIWKKTGDMDMQSVEFRIQDGTVVTA